MRQSDLKVWTEEWDGTPVIGAEGEIDLGCVDQLRDATSEVVRQKPQTVVFDLRKVSFIDSSGLGVLVATRRQLGHEPGAVTIITAQPAVLQSLEITGLHRVFTVTAEPAKQPVSAN